MVRLCFTLPLLHIKLDVPPFSFLKLITICRGFQTAHFTLLILFRCNKSNLLITDTQRTDILLQVAFEKCMIETVLLILRPTGSKPAW